MSLFALEDNRAEGSSPSSGNDSELLWRGLSASCAEHGLSGYSQNPIDQRLSSWKSHQESTAYLWSVAQSKLDFINVLLNTFTGGLR